VLATHQHEGRSRWLQHSVAEPIARQAGRMTLFIPHGVEGFVSRHDGAVSLRHILIPIAPLPRAQPAIAAAVRLVQRLQCPAGTFTTLFVGAPGDAPAVRCPAVPGWQWNSIVQSGNVIDAIVQAAGDMAAEMHMITPLPKTLNTANDVDAGMHGLEQRGTPIAVGQRTLERPYGKSRR
jgi:hypothetical protein